MPIIEAALEGKDILALLPTGGGKSICFQVPALSREGICIVVSPLIALMQDQVEHLQQKGIRAKAITSGMSYKELDQTLDNARFGGLDFLYTSPERLQSALFIERFKRMKIALLVVDDFAIYRWSPERWLWMPVRIQVMMVDASNHRGWDPGRDFWRSLRHCEEAPPAGLSACETSRPRLRRRCRCS